MLVFSKYNCNARVIFVEVKPYINTYLIHYVFFSTDFLFLVQGPKLIATKFHKDKTKGKRPCPPKVHNLCIRITLGMNCFNNCMIKQLNRINTVYQQELKVTTGKVTQNT